MNIVGVIIFWRVIMGIGEFCSFDEALRRRTLEANLVRHWR